MKPSALYRSGFWKMGLTAARVLPRPLSQFCACRLTALYSGLVRERKEIVVQNLLPAVNNNRTEAEAKARSLFRQFGLKLVDLWRYEAGLPMDNLFGEFSGWEHFERAHARGRGVLLLTPHLGNWEFGGPWLSRRGIKLQVITLAEPGRNFTELRQASRAKWNIETVVIGNDAFAFLEVIRRLEAGATVALLMDRPPPPTAVKVELFGRPFAASISAAELARATGCALLPVYIPRTGDAYGAHILPEVDYDRVALRDREERRKLTGNILHAFEPVLCNYLDQWFHFVPIWPK